MSGLRRGLRQVGLDEELYWSSGSWGISPLEGYVFPTQVGKVEQSWPVLLDNIPEFVIWRIGNASGLEETVEEAWGGS